MNWRPDNAPSTTSTTISNHASDQISRDATEVNPSIYDELKLGHKGAGFKRLVS